MIGWNERLGTGEKVEEEEEVEEWTGVREEGWVRGDISLGVGLVISEDGERGGLASN